MDQLTVGDILRKREELERDAASSLGRAMFAFSSLDMHLGLMVASALRCLGQDSQALKVGNLNFKARLAFLENYVETASDIPAAAIAEVKSWISRADRARLLRNQLVHGRWVAAPLENKIHNVVGLPSSDEQLSIKYTPEELDKVGEEFKHLNVALSKTRQRWHLP